MTTAKKDYEVFLVLLTGFKDATLVRFICPCPQIQSVPESFGHNLTSSPGNVDTECCHLPYSSVLETTSRLRLLANGNSCEQVNQPTDCLLTGLSFVLKHVN